MSTLPLKALSRLWGRFNEIPLPYYLRPAGFKLYSYIFGVKYVKPSNEQMRVANCGKVLKKLLKMTYTYTPTSLRSSIAN